MKGCVRSGEKQKRAKTYLWLEISSQVFENEKWWGIEISFLRLEKSNFIAVKLVFTLELNKSLLGKRKAYEIVAEVLLKFYSRIWYF